MRKILATVSVTASMVAAFVLVAAPETWFI